KNALSFLPPPPPMPTSAAGRVAISAAGRVVPISADGVYAVSGHGVDPGGVVTPQSYRAGISPAVAAPYKVTANAWGGKPFSSTDMIRPRNAAAATAAAIAADTAA
ncbi:unnamed protein product, partial [Laminaria digitata]